MRHFILISIILLLNNSFALAQNVGIGTNTPIARLEVKGTGTTSTTNNLVLKNSNGDTLLRMRNDGNMNIGYNGSIVGRTLNIGGTGVNFFRTDTDFGGSIFPTDTSMILWSQSNANNYVILQPSWGNVGIGTYSPKAKLHIQNGDSGATPASDAITVFESNDNASINLITPNANSSALYFGNQSNSRHGGFTYNSSIANGLGFRTNNVTRAVLDDAGNFGIGTFTPDSRLHVSNGTGGSVYHSEADLIVEDNTQAYIQFSTLNSSTSGLLAGNEVTDIRSAILFHADSSVQIRAGGNSTKINIDKSGNIAMGNFTPAFRLHLNNDSAAKPTSNSWTIPSDARLKKDVHDYADGLDEIMSIHPVWFTYNGEAGMPSETGVGVIAQELQLIAPYMVSAWNYSDKNEKLTPYLSVNNGPMIYMLINAIKEQQQQIKEQQAQIDMLFSEVSALKQTLIK